MTRVLDSWLALLGDPPSSVGAFVLFSPLSSFQRRGREGGREGSSQCMQSASEVIQPSLFPFVTVLSEVDKSRFETHSHSSCPGKSGV